MVKFKQPDLDAVFAALADPTRRGVLEALDGGSQSITELAAPYGMSLPGFMKHLAVLEAAGLIARAKEGRVVRCALVAAPMESAQMWLARYEKFWNEQLDSLGRYLYHQEELTSWSSKPSGNSPPSPSTATTPSPRKKSGTHGPGRKK